MQWLLLAVGIFTVAQIISALRCRYIAHTLGGDLQMRTSVKAHFVGLWFNQVFPTSLGGDVVKVGLLKRHLGWSIAIRSVILDRVSGLLFVLLWIVMLLPAYSSLFADPQLPVVLGLLAGGGLLGVLVLAKYSGKLAFLPGLGKVLTLFDDIWRFRTGRPLVEQLWTSFVVHVNGIVSYALLGYAIGLHQALWVYALVVPLVFLIALLPISFAGWGLREVGAVWLFGLVGVSPEKAMSLSVLFGIMLIVGSLPGLIMLFVGRSTTQEVCSTEQDK